jgi:uncharacterized membrane protein YkvA (DUF1232 family)
MAIKPTKANTKASEAYKAAESKASEYANDSAKLKKLIDDASNKASSNKNALQEVWETLLAFFRLLKAYAKGEYRSIPTTSLLMIIASIVYFLSPIDLIPDFIPIVGYLDDVTVIGWTMKSVQSDIDDFRDWESGHA